MRFSLQRMRFRGKKLVDDRTVAEEAHTLASVRSLLGLPTNSVVPGLLRLNAVVLRTTDNKLLFTPNGDLTATLTRDPKFPQKITAAYRVTEVHSAAATHED